MVDHFKTSSETKELYEKGFDAWNAEVETQRKISKNIYFIFDEYKFESNIFEGFDIDLNIEFNNCNFLEFLNIKNIKNAISYKFYNCNFDEELSIDNLECNSIEFYNGYINKIVIKECKFENITFNRTNYRKKYNINNFTVSNTEIKNSFGINITEITFDEFELNSIIANKNAIINQNTFSKIKITDSLFNHTILFNNNKVLSESVFEYCDFKRGLNLNNCEFQFAPSFNQCKFFSPFDVNSFKILENVSSENDIENIDFQHRYRILRKLASESNNHLQEIAYFEKELSTRTDLFAKWIGKRVYVKLFKTGTSIVSPIVGFIILLCINFCVISAISSYKKQVMRIDYSNINLCVENDNANNIVSSILKISFFSILPFGNTITNDKLYFYHKCIFGTKFKSLKNETSKEIDYPFLYSFFSYIFSIFTSILLFLFLLAIRNRLKIS